MPENETANEIIEKMIPEEREAVRRLITNLTNELMQKSQELRLAKRDLKDASRRKKAKSDPILGKVCLVMFSRPRQEGAKVRMHVADNCPSTQAISTVKSILRDKDHEFISVHFLQEMKGRSDGLSRLELNSEAVWHLFQKLDQQSHSEGKKKESSSDTAGE